MQQVGGMMVLGKAVCSVVDWEGMSVALKAMMTVAKMDVTMVA